MKKYKSTSFNIARLLFPHRVIELYYDGQKAIAKV